MLGSSKHGHMIIVGKIRLGYFFSVVIIFRHNKIWKPAI